MQSVSEVLTTAEELIADGEDVGPMLASFLKTLLIDLDKVLVSEGPTGVRQRALPVDPSSPPVKPTPSNAPDVGKTKRPVVNKYEGKCVRCKGTVTPGSGFVLPSNNPVRGKKWLTFCAADYAKENR